MDLDSTVKLIFPDGIPDSWSENPEFTAYLTKLGLYGVSKISKEPDYLAAEKGAILNQTQDLAFSNYKTFIQTAECSREIFQQFQRTENCLDSLLYRMPQFTTEAEDFIKKCDEIKTERHINSLSLSKYGQILQLLEAPQLMDTVIREGLYDDALRLAAYVKRLAKAHKNVALIQKLAKDIEECWEGLTKKLIWELHTELQLPRCLHVIGVLRRMSVFSELELRLKFLQARDNWFSNLIKMTPRDDAQHLNKVVDLYRTHMFNIITQYRAVFPQQESLLVTNKQNFNDYSVLQEWINNKVCEFVSTIERETPEGSEAVSSLEQVMYFGQSLGRVGSDLRALVAPIYIRKLAHSLSLQIRLASEQFAADMDKFSLESNSLSAQVLPPVTEPQSETSPPVGLMSYYPLGRYANSIIACFNQVRLCAPLCIAQPLTQMLEHGLITVASTIAQFYRREQQAMHPDEKDLLTKMVICFNDCLVPYIQRCLHMLFSPVEISTFLSVPVYKLREQRLTFFDMEAIRNPVNHLIPVFKNYELSNIPDSELGKQVEPQSDLIVQN